MSLVFTLCITLGIAVGGLGFLLFRRRAWVWLVLGALISVGSAVWFLTPVCVAIPNSELGNFDPPIDARTDTGLIGQRYFQKRDGVWFHCKVRIARQLFF